MQRTVQRHLIVTDAGRGGQAIERTLYLCQPPTYVTASIASSSPNDAEHRIDFGACGFPNQDEIALYRGFSNRCQIDITARPRSGRERNRRLSRVDDVVVDAILDMVLVILGELQPVIEYEEPSLLGILVTVIPSGGSLRTPPPRLAGPGMTVSIGPLVPRPRRRVIQRLRRVKRM